MVIKQITQQRKNIFTENLQVILQAMHELVKIGVSQEEISEFLYNWMHEKTIFEGKFTYDFKNSTFIHESNYPMHLEYYQHIKGLSQNIIDEDNSIENDESEEIEQEDFDQNEKKEIAATPKTKKLNKEKKKKKKKKKKVGFESIQ